MINLIPVRKINMNNVDEEIKKRIANALEARISILRGIVNTKTTIKRSGGLFDSFDYS